MIAAVGALALGVSACGGDDGDGTATSTDDNGGMTVEILQPADGDTISVPFTLEVESSEELGTTDTGLHHVHVFFDGDDDAYEVFEEGNREAREITADSPAVAGSRVRGAHPQHLVAQRRPLTGGSRDRDHGQRRGRRLLTVR